MQANSATPLAKRQTCILVIGMHRSGTSAVARVINLLGADITGGLMPAVPGNNEAGFWESLAVCIIHDDLLPALGSRWDDPMPLPERWLEASATRDAKRLLMAELAKDFPASELFVVKDPRIARLLPLWLEILDELDIEPVVVIPFRDPLEIAASLQQRDGMPATKALLLYVRSYLEADRATRDRRRLFVSYPDLLDDWPTFANQLATLVAPHEPVASTEARAEIASFLSADLRHNRSAPERLTTSPGIAATVIEIHDRMTEVAKTGDEAKLRASFDRLRATVDEASLLYDGLVVAERQQTMALADRLRVAESELEATREKALASEALAAAEAAGRDEIARLQAAMDQLQAAFDAETKSREDLSAAIRVSRGETTTLRAMLSARNNENAILREALAGRERRLAALKASWSWWMTTPLRRLGSLLRRPRRADP